MTNREGHSNNKTPAILGDCKLILGDEGIEPDSSAGSLLVIRMSIQPSWLGDRRGSYQIFSPSCKSVPVFA